MSMIIAYAIVFAIIIIDTYWLVRIVLAFLQRRKRICSMEANCEALKTHEQRPKCLCCEQEMKPIYRVGGMFFSGWICANARCEYMSFGVLVSEKVAEGA